jgi:hypothetical protein
VIPIIEGNIQDARTVSGKIPFRNLDSLTDFNLVPGNPDLYYGARPERIDRRVRRDLDSKIIPSTQKDLPIAPNFFLAAKGPDGTPAVAERQTSYDGTLGERGQLSLRSYGEDTLQFDHNAHTITSTYHAGTLKMYSVYGAQPAGPSNRPEYYMHQIDTWGMTGNPRSFRNGATAYRNLRDWADEQRNEAIQLANARVERAVDEEEETHEVSIEGRQAELSSTAFSFSCEASNSTFSALVDEQQSEPPYSLAKAAVANVRSRALKVHKVTEFRATLLQRTNLSRKTGIS